MNIKLIMKLLKPQKTNLLVTKISKITLKCQTFPKIRNQINHAVYKIIMKVILIKFK